MPIPWTVKKQIIFFIFFALSVSGTVFLIWTLASNPTCFDNKQNQGELGADCGGPCQPCVGEIKDIIVVWTKPFELQNGRYDVAAMVENPNLFAGLPSLGYKFKLYDANNILVAVREGETFINPGDNHVIFEAGIDTGRRVPKRAFIELQEDPKWERIEGEIPQIIVSRKDFANNPFPRLNAEISNKSLFAVNDVYGVAVLYGGDGNAIAASATKIDSIGGNSSRQVAFTWPAPFSQEPASSKIFLRTDLTKYQD